MQGETSLLPVKGESLANQGDLDSVGRRLARTVGEVHELWGKLGAFLHTQVSTHAQLLTLCL